MDRPDFNLSPEDRIRIVHDSLALWMRNNNIALHEVRRALAMMMRLSDEQRHQAALERRQSH